MSSAARRGAARRHVAKWTQTVRISWAKQMAYKANLVLLVIGPLLVFFFIRYSLWTEVFRARGAVLIRGYDLAAMLRYQGLVLVVALLAQGHTNMQIAEDIRLGRISAYLVYPFQFWQFHAASFLAFQAQQTLIAAGTVLALRLLGVLPPLDAPALAAGLALAWLVSALWFTVQFFLGLLSFWMENTWVLRAMFLTASQFLSGAMLPLEVFPAWLRRGLAYSPFPYLTWAPVKVLMGDYPPGAWSAALALGLWLALGASACALLWRRGLKLYTGAGM